MYLISRTMGSLLPAGSDLAYETMYDNDEIMGTQTMPWFDPK